MNGRGKKDWSLLLFSKEFLWNSWYPFNISSTITCCTEHRRRKIGVCLFLMKLIMEIQGTQFTNSAEATILLFVLHRHEEKFLLLKNFRLE
jgi:hypothetical protein